MNSLPIITLELNALGQRVRNSLMCKANEINDLVEQQIKLFCNPQKLQMIIQSQVEASMNSIIREEVDNYFKFGEGRKMINSIVQITLGTTVEGSLTDET